MPNILLDCTSEIAPLKAFADWIYELNFSEKPKYDNLYYTRVDGWFGSMGGKAKNFFSVPKTGPKVRDISDNHFVSFCRSVTQIYLSIYPTLEHQNKIYEIGQFTICKEVIITKFENANIKIRERIEEALATIALSIVSQNNSSVTDHFANTVWFFYEMENDAVSEGRLAFTKNSSNLDTTLYMPDNKSWAGKAEYVDDGNKLKVILQEKNADDYKLFFLEINSNETEPISYDGWAHFYNIERQITDKKNISVIKITSIHKDQTPKILYLEDLKNENSDLSFILSLQYRNQNYYSNTSALYSYNDFILLEKIRHTAVHSKSKTWCYDLYYESINESPNKSRTEILNDSPVAIRGRIVFKMLSADNYLIKFYPNIIGDEVWTGSLKFSFPQKNKRIRKSNFIYDLYLEHLRKKFAQQNIEIILTKNAIDNSPSSYSLTVTFGNDLDTPFLGSITNSKDYITDIGDMYFLNRNHYLAFPINLSQSCHKIEQSTCQKLILLNDIHQFNVGKNLYQTFYGNERTTIFKDTDVKLLIAERLEIVTKANKIKNLMRIIKYYLFNKKAN